MNRSTQRSITFRARRAEERERMQILLAKFAAHYEPWMDSWRDDSRAGVYAEAITFGDLREARALSPQGKKGGE